MPDAGSSGLILGAEEDPRQTNLIDVKDHNIRGGGASPQLIGLKRGFHSLLSICPIPPANALPFLSFRPDIRGGTKTSGFLWGRIPAARGDAW